MKLKPVSALLLGLCVAAGSYLPAFADGINARVKSVDPQAHTITVVERQEDHVFTVTDATQFLDGDGKVIATGLKIGDKDILEFGVQSGALKAGTRLAVTFDKQDDKFVASQVQLRDRKAEQHD